MMLQKFWLSAFLATCATLPLCAQQAAASPADSVPTFKTGSSLVSLPLVVRDKHGDIVTKLTKDDLTVMEDGKPQTIRYFDHDVDLPLTLGLLVDVSGSVRDVLDEERTASKSFLEQMVRPTDKAFVIEFGREVDLLCNLTASHAALQSALAQLAPMPVASSDSTGSDTHGAQHGGSQLYDAVFLAADEVIKKEPNRKALILLTDGVDRGSMESIASAIEAAQRADTIVYAIYFQGEEHHDHGFSHDHDGGGGNGGGRSGGGWPGGGGGGWPGSGGGWPGGGGGRGGNGGGNHPQDHEQGTDGRKILQRMTQETGGGLFQVSKKLPVDAIYQQIAEELRNQYRLSYAPPAHDGAGYHEVQVQAKDKKLTVQTRAGYYADK